MMAASLMVVAAVTSAVEDRVVCRARADDAQAVAATLCAVGVLQTRGLSEPILMKESDYRAMKRFEIDLHKYPLISRDTPGGHRESSAALIWS